MFTIHSIDPDLYFAIYSFLGVLPLSVFLANYHTSTLRYLSFIFSATYTIQYISGIAYHLLLLFISRFSLRLILSQRYTPGSSVATSTFKDRYFICQTFYIKPNVSVPLTDLPYNRYQTISALPPMFLCPTFGNKGRML